jgi:hypothetical protein
MSQTLAVVDERGYSVLKYRDKTPILAACARCQLKFFTPSEMMNDWMAASDYLWKKHYTHQCVAASARYKDRDDSLPTRGSRLWWASPSGRRLKPSP